MTKDELIETLASVQHQIWTDWQKYLHSQCWGQTPGDLLTIRPEDRSRWERRIVQPYAMLSEDEKEYYDAQVMRYWPVIREFVGQWIASASLTGDATPDVTYIRTDALARKWRKETESSS